MTPYERDNILHLSAYQPGEQPQVAGVVKLNTNENPYPPPKAVLEAIHSVSADSLRRYPPPTANAFRQMAAQVHGLSPDQVIATNGGDELLRLSITVFCEPRCSGCSNKDIKPAGGVGITDPTYSLYPVLAAIHPTPVTRVSLTDEFALPDNLGDRFNQAGCCLALIVNPHAPSGRLQPLDQLEKLARQFQGVVLIDEAYVDFACQDALGLLYPDRGLNNVLILRTLSKGYSLAGIRFGYGLGHRDLITALDKARDSYNTDILSQTAALAALTHRDAAMQACQKVIQERDRLGQQLAERRFKVYPSQTNFLLVSPRLDAGSIYESLKAKHVYVRYFDQPGLQDKLRITVGTPEQNDALLAALDSL